MKHHAFCNEDEATEALCDFRDHGNTLETELACEKENRNHLIEKGAKLETELAAERAIVSRIWMQLGSPTYAELKGRSIYDLIDEIKTDRAELERADVLYQRSCAVEHALRAEAERLNGYCEELHTIIDNHGYPSGIDYAKMEARAERAEAALAEWSVLNLWGGTPEIIHEFIKGQQNRIHHCQDLETELARLRADLAASHARAERAEAAFTEATDGVIDGGSIPDTLLVVHVPRSPVGYRVGQPVKVILPALSTD